MIGSGAVIGQYSDSFAPPMSRKGHRDRDRDGPPKRCLDNTILKTPHRSKVESLEKDLVVDRRQVRSCRAACTGCNHEREAVQTGVTYTPGDGRAVRIGDSCGHSKSNRRRS